MSAPSNPFHVAASHIDQMRQAAIYADGGALPARIKALAALLWSVSSRCEPCIAHYARKAIDFGATREEMSEMLAIASTMGGCVGETWALKAFAAAKATNTNEAEMTCCPQ